MTSSEYPEPDQPDPFSDLESMQAAPPPDDQPDLFDDPARFRVSGDLEPATEQGPLTAVPVRKPKRDEFFRVRDEAAYTGDFLIVEDDDEDRTTYLVLPTYADAVVETARLVRLHTCMSRRSTTFLWPCKIPQEGAGRVWATSALKVADDAKRVWVRMYGDRGLGAYAYVRARGNLDEPKWRDEPFGALLRIAFTDHVIDSADHPYIRRLRGEL